MSLCYNFDHAEEEQQEDIQQQNSDQGGIKTTKAITQKDGGMVEQSTQKRKCEEIMPVHVQAKRKRMQLPKVSISACSKTTFAEVEWKCIEGIPLNRQDRCDDNNNVYGVIIIMLYVYGHTCNFCLLLNFQDGDGEYNTVADRQHHKCHTESA